MASENKKGSGENSSKGNGKSKPTMSVPVSRDTPSQVTYSDVAEYFITGEPVFEGDDKRIVWSKAFNGDSGEFIIKVLADKDTPLGSRDDTVYISNSLLFGGMPIPVQLKVTQNIQTMLGLGIRGTAAQIKAIHEDSYNDMLEDSNNIVIGTSDSDGKVTYNGLDMLYMLFTKGQGRGRTESNYKVRNLLMHDDTLATLLAHEDFKDKVKLHVPKARKIAQ